MLNKIHRAYSTQSREQVTNPTGLSQKRPLRDLCRHHAVSRPCDDESPSAAAHAVSTQVHTPQRDWSQALACQASTGCLSRSSAYEVPHPTYTPPLRPSRPSHTYPILDPSHARPILNGPHPVPTRSGAPPIRIHASGRAGRGGAFLRTRRTRAGR